MPFSVPSRVQAAGADLYAFRHASPAIAHLHRVRLALPPRGDQGADAWNAKNDADKQAALGSGKMNDPKSAMEYLGVT